jgi:uncharacterized protein (TIGR03437 family)
MKFFSAAIIAAISTCAVAADFHNGQSARMTIGQPTFPAQVPGASNTILGAAGGLAYAGDMLFVADSNRIGPTPLNNRVVIYKNISQKFPSPTDQLAVGPRCAVCTADPTVPRPADVVVGQPDFSTILSNVTQNGMRLPTAIASDGKILVVADTDNNRVLIWNNIPASNGANADIELGQDDFNSVRQPIVTDNKSFRGPQGVWLQNGRLFVADTQNHRVMIWNSVPTQNNQPADIVLGVADFNTNPDATLGGPSETPTSSNLLNPVSVTSDGVRLYVADLGHNRVVIWNDINSLSTNRPFDVVIGQPDTVSSIGNNSSAVCASNGSDSNNNPTYPFRCAATLNFPRFALSDGTRLFVADGGNDRVLVWNRIPIFRNGVPADEVLGQPDMNSDVNTDNSSLFNPNFVQSSSDTIRTPTSLAWDGTNLYVADPSDRRVLVYTPNPQLVQPNGIRNSASLAIYAVGSVVFSGTPTNGETVTVTIGIKDSSGNATNTHDYTYTMKQNDTIALVVQGMTALINAGGGDPYVFATADPVAGVVLLTARAAGADGNNVSVSTTQSNSASTLTVSATAPTGGQNAARIAPGSLVTLFGSYLCDCDPTSDSSPIMPRELAGVQVYIDGIPAPINYVSPSQINAQIPWELIQYGRGSIVFSGTPVAGATVTVGIGTYDNSGNPANPVNYTYTVQQNDTLAQVVNGVAGSINGSNNGAGDPNLYASPNTAASTVVLVAQVSGNTSTAISTTATLSANSGMNTAVNAVGPADNAISVTAWIRQVRKDSTVIASASVGIPITPENPGVFTQYGTDPRPGIAVHAYTNATAVVSVDGTVTAGNTGTITIGSNSYTYTVLSTDTLGSIRDAFVSQINANPKEIVTAAASGVFTRIIIQAKAKGSAGNGIAISTTTSSGATLILTALQAATCCANTGGASVTTSNPAIAGETIVVYATGMGAINPLVAQLGVQTGVPYGGPLANAPVSSVSSLVGGKTANVLFSGMVPGTVGLYEIYLQLNSSLPTDPLTKGTIAQDIYVSNVFTIPVKAP